MKGRREMFETFCAREHDAEQFVIKFSEIKCSLKTNQKPSVLPSMASTVTMVISRVASVFVKQLHASAFCENFDLKLKFDCIFGQ